MAAGRLGTTGKIKKLVATALLCAIAYAAMLVIHIPVSFLTIDPKDTIIVIAGFMMGPVVSLIMALVVAFLEMITVSGTGLIGFMMNALSSCAFACTAAVIYKRRHSKKGAVTALLAAVAAQTVIMLLWDWLMVPMYMEYATRQMVVSMLVPLFLPFNLLKGGINMALTMLLYKPVITAVRRIGLVPKHGGEKKGGIDWAFMVFAAVLLAACVVLALILGGII